MQIFGEAKVQEFAEECVSFFAIHGARDFAANDSATAKLYEILKKTVKGSTLNRLVQAILVTCPHSMITERAVKHHTILKTDIRSSMDRLTVNKILIISMNGVGTAYYDPRPAVCKFLRSKERRKKNVDLTLYKSCDFVKKFFRLENSI